MRLIPVDTEASIPAACRCVVCGEWRNTGELYADLDGTPYVSYYCRTDYRKLGGVVVKACANKFPDAQFITREAL